MSHGATPVSSPRISPVHMSALPSLSAGVDLSGPDHSSTAASASGEFTLASAPKLTKIRDRTAFIDRIFFGQPSSRDPLVDAAYRHWPEGGYCLYLANVWYRCCDQGPGNRTCPSYSDPVRLTLGRAVILTVSVPSSYDATALTNGAPASCEEAFHLGVYGPHSSRAAMVALQQVGNTNCFIIAGTTVEEKTGDTVWIGGTFSKAGLQELVNLKGDAGNVWLDVSGRYSGQNVFCRG